MALPTNAEEYAERFRENQVMTGFGGGVEVHSPCPFCAAADWQIFKIVSMEDDTALPVTCAECGRTAQILYTHKLDGGVHFEVVQTGGDDPPEWLPGPPMRRVDR